MAPPAALLGDRYVLGKLIGEGSFGRVYRAFDAQKRRSVALKVETGFSTNSALNNEARVLRTLTAEISPQGFPRYFHFTQEGLCQLLVMEVLGRSLIDVLQTCGGRLSVRSTVLAGQQMLLRIEYLHSRGFVHQDIKPDNFVFGLGSRQHHLHLIDFGLTKAYYTTSHMRPSRHRGMIGTARYASLNAHSHYEQSRRDDLEALGYNLVYLMTGTLPWSGMKAENPDHKCKLVGECKKATPLSTLCKGCPQAVALFIAHCRALSFTERPDYEYLRGLLSDTRAILSEEKGRTLQDHEFQWIGKSAGVSMLEPLHWPPSDDLRQPDDTAGGRRKRDALLACVGMGMSRGSVSRPTANCLSPLEPMALTSSMNSCESMGGGSSSCGAVSFGGDSAASAPGTADGSALGGKTQKASFPKSQRTEGQQFLGLIGGA